MKWERCLTPVLYWIVTHAVHEAKAYSWSHVVSELLNGFWLNLMISVCIKFFYKIRFFHT
jgi:hypothetical protein